MTLSEDMGDHEELYELTQCPQGFLGFSEEFGRAFCAANGFIGEEPMCSCRVQQHGWPRQGRFVSGLHKKNMTEEVVKVLKCSFCSEDHCPGSPMVREQDAAGPENAWDILGSDCLPLSFCHERHCAQCEPEEAHLHLVNSINSGGGFRIEKLQHHWHQLHQHQHINKTSKLMACFSL